MWLISWRDLQFRRRRFAIATAATGLVFTVALLLTGISRGFETETNRTVEAFGADAWIVPDGAVGPFTSTQAFVPDGLFDGIAGATHVEPLTMSRVTVLEPSPHDVIIFGTEIDGRSPRASVGRRVRGPGEIVVDASLGLAVGDRLRLVEDSFLVVGTFSGLTLFAGSPTAVVALADAQKISFGAQPLVTALAVRGRPAAAPTGYHLVTNTQAITDVRRPLGQATDTINFLRVLMWIIAIGIIGSIVYLTVLERTRDFAVLKATGVTGRAIFGGLLIESVLIAVVAAGLAIVLSILLEPVLALRVEIGIGTYLFLPVVASLAGAASSLVGLRRAVGVDPALAFG